MRVALGFKSHSGWTALVTIGDSESGFEVIDRRRLELIDDGELWAKQPYHASEDLAPVEASEVVRRGIESAQQIADRQIREAVSRIRKRKYEIAGCSVLVPEPMPPWSTREILDVHFRMHKAEGVLFPDALCRAAAACKLPLFAVREKQIAELAESTFGVPMSCTAEMIADLGKTVGPPWGKDQKSAALAAMIALKGILE